MDKIRCIECEAEIEPPSEYHNIEQGDLRCKNCDAMISVKFESGELKKNQLIRRAYSHRV